MQNGFVKEAYQRRLRMLRRIYGMNQTEFAKYVGITYKKWNHYERGYPVSRESAFILQQVLPGFSIDWLWFGVAANFDQMLKESELLRAEQRKHTRPRPHALPKVRERIVKMDKRQRKKA
jgi:transcriptional regulator with XRE-family HTH domain